MKQRLSIFAAVVLVTIFPLTSPLRACCDDFWSCVGAVASGGLTCAVEGLINTVRVLIDNVNRLISTLANQVSDVVNLARTELGNAANDIRGLASQAESDFGAAAQLAATVVNDANRPQVIKAPLSQAAVAAGSRVAVAPSAGSATAKPLVAGARPTAVHTAGLGTATPVGGTAGAGTVAHFDPPVDARELQDALRRAKEVIDGLRPDITAPLNQVRNFAVQAEQQVASAGASAAGIADSALMGPLRVVGNLLGDLVAHPERIFDPSSIVDDAINQVTAQVITTMNQVHDAVMSQARATLNQANQPLQDVLNRAAVAKKIADAMQKLERARTKSALDGLNAVVPRQRVDVRTLVSHVSLASHASGVVALDPNRSKTLVASPFARLDSVKLTARTVGTQMNSKLKGPWTEFKRLKATPVRLDPSAKPRMDAEIERRFAGKSAAEAAAEKRTLLAEARTRFAKDPDLLRKVEIIIEGHPVINSRIGGTINARPANVRVQVQPPGVRQ